MATSSIQSGSPLQRPVQLFRGAYVRQNSITGEFSASFTGADAKPVFPEPDTVPVRNPFSHPVTLTFGDRTVEEIPAKGEKEIPVVKWALSSPKVTPVGFWEEREVEALSLQE